MIESSAEADALFADAVLTADPDIQVAVQQAGFPSAEILATAQGEVFAPDGLADTDPVEQELDPWVEHAQAAERAGVQVRAVETHMDVAAAVSVLDDVFGSGAGHFYPPSLLRNILAAGGPIAVAWEGADPLGTVLSLPSWNGSGPFLQSGPMGVVPGARGRGLALALKSHQRAWCLERGVREVRWTFDLMVRTNARLNLHTLRADALEFLPGYEGVRPPGFGPELPNDRLLVRWDLTSPARQVTVRRRVREHGGADIPWAVAGVDGEPQVQQGWSAHPLVRVESVADMLTLRREEPELASRWQQAVGGVLREALDAGCRVAVDATGRYLVARPYPG